MLCGFAEAPSCGFGASCFRSSCALIFLISDLLCLTERTAKVKQVIKNAVDRMVVARVRNVLVLVPNMDSTPEKLSIKPLPRPRWIKTRPINAMQIIVWIIIIKIITLMSR